MNEQPVIHTRGLTRYFGANPAVYELDLEVPRGGVFALLGRNGSMVCLPATTGRISSPPPVPPHPSPRPIRWGEGGSLVVVGLPPRPRRGGEGWGEGELAVLCGCARYHLKPETRIDHHTPCPYSAARPIRER